MATVLGIDEAGRGAVIGPLIVAGVLAEETELGHLRALGAQDSKRVPRPRRRGILRRIAKAQYPVRTVVIEAWEVDACNLTELELSAAARLIQRLSPDRVVVDAPVVPGAIPRFLSRLSGLSGCEASRLSAFAHADRTHPAVGAASLAAKVTRDAFVLFLREKFGDFGWGYPGEEKAARFLEEWLQSHGELPSICRIRWRSVRNLLDPELLDPWNRSIGLYSTGRGPRP
jgi:ribonuclease HII